MSHRDPPLAKGTVVLFFKCYTERDDDTPSSSTTSPLTPVFCIPLLLLRVTPSPSLRRPMSFFPPRMNLPFSQLSSSSPSFPLSVLQSRFRLFPPTGAPPRLPPRAAPLCRVLCAARLSCGLRNQGLFEGSGVDGQRERERARRARRLYGRENPPATTLPVPGLLDPRRFLRATATRRDRFLFIGSLLS